MTLIRVCLNIRFHSSIGGIASCQQADCVSSEAEGNSAAQGGPWGPDIRHRKGAPCVLSASLARSPSLPAKREELAKQVEASSPPVSELPLANIEVLSGFQLLLPEAWWTRGCLEHLPL